MRVGDDVKQPVAREGRPVRIFLDVENATFTKQPVPKAHGAGSSLDTSVGSASGSGTATGVAASQAADGGIAASIHSDFANATISKKPVAKARGDGLVRTKTIFKTPVRQSQATKPLVTAPVLAAQDTGPPQGFAFALACFAKPGRIDELLGDAEKDYHDMALRFRCCTSEMGVSAQRNAEDHRAIARHSGKDFILLRLGLW